MTRSPSQVVGAAETGISHNLFPSDGSAGRSISEARELVFGAEPAESMRAPMTSSGLDRDWADGPGAAQSYALRLFIPPFQRSYESDAVLDMTAIVWLPFSGSGDCASRLRYPRDRTFACDLSRISTSNFMQFFGPHNPAQTCRAEDYDFSTRQTVYSALDIDAYRSPYGALEHALRAATLTPRFTIALTDGTRQHRCPEQVEVPLGARTVSRGTYRVAFAQDAIDGSTRCNSWIELFGVKHRENSGRRAEQMDALSRTGVRRRRTASSIRTADAPPHSQTLLISGQPRTPARHCRSRNSRGGTIADCPAPKPNTNRFNDHPPGPPQRQGARRESCSRVVCVRMRPV